MPMPAGSCTEAAHIACGAGAGVGAYWVDGRARVPGLGVRRVQAPAEPPRAWSVALPGLLEGVLTAHNRFGRAGLGSLTRAAVASVRDHTPSEAVRARCALVEMLPRLLPLEEKNLELTNEKEVFQAIRELAVRGAPAIGITAAYGTYISLKKFDGLTDTSKFREEARKIIHYLEESRPTAYNLFYALQRMCSALEESASSVISILARLKKEACDIHREDLEKSEKIAFHGITVIPQDARIISHCNAGGLATGGNGTSLAVIFQAQKEEKNVFIYVDETRPLLQGARLTAWELSKKGIPYEVICDNMAGMLMSEGKVDLVILGADRIALNGDFANKIGTYSLAVLAQYHGIPFYTAAPVSTFDFSIRSGKEIPIEKRDSREVVQFGGVVRGGEHQDG